VSQNVLEIFLEFVESQPWKHQNRSRIKLSEPLDEEVVKTEYDRYTLKIGAGKFLSQFNCDLPAVFAVEFVLKYLRFCSGQYAQNSKVPAHFQVIGGRTGAAIFCDEDTHYAAYTLEASPDGVHWQRIVNKTGAIQDCSRVFYNPFRQVWAFSIKTGVAGFGRQRAYWERPDLFHGPGWGVGDWKPTMPHPPPGAPFPWPTIDFADDRDALAPHLPSGQKLPRRDLSHPSYPQVYTVDAVPYESLMVGLFVIIECDMGGEGCDQTSDHEMDEVFVAFSRGDTLHLPIAVTFHCPVTSV
jgi:hypothetical protein